MKRFLALLLAVVTALTCIPFAGALNNWNMEYFLKKYPDPHFNLANEPNRAMTVEEFIAIIYVYSYYGDGNKNVTCRDKNGKAPSVWCAPYVQAEVDKKVVTPGDVSWTQPVTLAFAAQYLSRAKGKYSYDSTNLYTFTGTQGLGADDLLYLSVAVDYGLIPYQTNMDVSKTILRKDARKYEIPSGAVAAKAAIPGNGNTMRENHVYFTDCYWDLNKATAQYRHLITSSSEITMVTFLCAYINGVNASKQNRFLYCNMNHEEAVKYNVVYDHDPELDALKWCKDNGKLSFLGISNAANSSFTDKGLREILSSDANMNTAITEFVAATKNYGMSGINLGIELPESAHDLKDAYDVFLKKLSDALHQNGLLLLVTTGAYFTEAQEAASFYDYAVINEVADYVHIILYDDFNDTGYPWRKTDGAVSNYVRIGRCLRYAATRIDPHKILLGMSNFATDFNRSTYTAQDIPYADAVALQKKTGASMQWDANSRSTYFDYWDQENNTHRVWMESPESYSYRTQYVRQYDLCGFSTFYLASDAPELLHQQTSVSAFFPEVSAAISRNLIPNHLRHDYDAPITRAEFCDIIAAFLEEVVGLNLQQILQHYNLISKPFNDCSISSVQFAGTIGIVTGYPDGTFRPNNTITRQEAATMLTRLAKFCGMNTPNAQSVQFSELPTMQAWAKEGVSFISACEDPSNGKRVMGGTGNGKFSPYGLYTREQSAMTMIRLLNALKK